MQEPPLNLFVVNWNLLSVFRFYKDYILLDSYLMKTLIFLLFFISFSALGQFPTVVDSLHREGLLPIEYPDNETVGFIPEIDLEKREIKIPQPEIGGVIIVLKPSHGVELSLNGHLKDLVVGQLYYFGLYTHQEEIPFFSENTNPFDSLFCYLVPDIHLVYYNASNNRSSSPFESRNLSYGHELLFKNFRPDSLLMSSDKSHQILIKSNDDKVLLDLLNNESKKPKIEGWQYHVQHDTELFSISFWDHTNPVLYNKSIKVWVKNHPGVFEFFENKIGLRDIKWVNNRLQINKKAFKLKPYLLDEKVDDISVLITTLKKHHFNTIILQSSYQPEVFDICDSLGLYVIQLVDDGIFKDWQDWLSYHIKIKDHASFIAWYDRGANSFTQRLMRELDAQKLVLNGDSFRQPFYSNWNEMSALNQKNVRIQNQPFEFFFSQGQKTINIKKKEYFRYHDDLNVEIVFLDSAGNLLFQEISDFPSTAQERVDINLSEYEIPKPEAGGVLEINLLMRNTINEYKSGEVVASSVFESKKTGQHFEFIEKSAPVSDEFLKTQIK